MEEEKIVVNKFVNEASDSLEIGTPGKSGCVKIYGNFADVEAFKKKIDNAKEVKEYAQTNIGINI